MWKIGERKKTKIEEEGKEREEEHEIIKKYERK